MTCSISDSQWIDYLDNALSRSERQEIDSHLMVCSACCSQLTEFRQVDQRLRIECGEILQAMARSGVPPIPSTETIRATLREVAAVASPKRSQERLWQMRWVLALLCGSNTAVRIISAAESHANIPANTDPGEQKWLAFLDRLSFLTTEICGRAAGELIFALGK